MQSRGDRDTAGKHSKAISAFLHAFKREPRLERVSQIPVEVDALRIMRAAQPHPVANTRFLFTGHKDVPTDSITVDPAPAIEAARREPERTSRRHPVVSWKSDAVLVGMYDPIDNEPLPDLPQPSRYRQKALELMGEGLEQVARVFYSYRDSIPLCLAFQQLFCESATDARMVLAFPDAARRPQRR
jgi:hypothetical protein